MPARGHTPPHVPALRMESDLAVIRSDGAPRLPTLTLGLDAIAGPDAEANAIALSVSVAAATPQRASELPRSGDRHASPHSDRRRGDRGTPAAGVALDMLGVKVARTSPLLPDLAHAGKIYTRLLSSIFGAFLPLETYASTAEAAKALPASDESLAAWRRRGTVLSHRDWILPMAPVPACASSGVACLRSGMSCFARRCRRPRFLTIIRRNKRQAQYRDRWQSLSLPPTRLFGRGWRRSSVCRPPPRRSAVRRVASPIGVQIIGPYLEDRTTLRFAELIEREFGGFVAPPALVTRG